MKGPYRANDYERQKKQSKLCLQIYYFYRLLVVKINLLNIPATLYYI